MSRLNPEERYKQLLDSAIEVAKLSGFGELTHSLVALHAKVSKATVFHYFKTIEILRDTVMTIAVDDEILPVIAGGIAANNQVAIAAPAELKRKSLASLV